MLQLLHEGGTNCSVGEADFKPGSGACDGLNDVGATYKAYEVAALAHNGNALDVLFFERICNLEERRIGEAVSTSRVMTSFTLVACDLT